MKFLHYTLAVALATLMLLNSVPSVTACGPSEMQPIFVFKESPDLPLEEFTNGKIGIVRPSFGRKTLVIAYRYLNGGSFTSDEQSELIAALKGQAPEEDGLAAVKAWIDGRKELVKEEEEKLPAIYTERQHGGYEFFPNCTKNAFEVALETLKDRAASYGADDRNVRAWLAAQDIVFENCSGGAQIPSELGAESVSWLRKDRDYQIAAANFYSLNFDEARSRFAKISADADSPWQAIAGYLVGRTLIRQASLGEDETKKRELYAQAESHLQSLVVSGGKYTGAAKKLVALVKYHLHPEERVIELGRALAAGNDENLRQDLIDFVWLLDKLESRILNAEEERKKEPQPAPETEPADSTLTEEQKERNAKRERGDLIHIALYDKKPDGSLDYLHRFAIEIDYDASEAKVLAAFEQGLGRKLTDDETNFIKESRQSQLSYRKWRLSPIRKWEHRGLSDHEGCDYNCTRLTLDLTPDFLRSDELSDWILTVQTADPGAYKHALSKWRETNAPAWLVTALMKAEKSSPGVPRLMQAAERVTRDEPNFATVAYHLVRLKAALGHTDEARKTLDEIISWQAGVLPVSAQNQFLEQRLQLARGLNDFLKSAPRKPVTFYDYGTYGKLSDFLTIAKSFWTPTATEQSKEEYERELDERYKDLLPWDNRLGFDGATLEIFNWHFPLQLLAEAARNPNIPDYLQRSLVLAVWTRAIVLKNDQVALKIAPEVVKVEPKMGAVFERYLKSRTPKQRQTAALFVLLRFPNLSPLVQGGLPSFYTSDELDYYFEGSWWCQPLDTDYNEKGEEVPKVVPKPNFLTATQLETARREHEALAALGDAKSYLGKQAIEWAKTSPADPRIPEVLFIAARANESYKYGCNSFEFDQQTKEAAEKMLRQRYPQSPWAAKLEKPEN